MRNGHAFPVIGLLIASIALVAMWISGVHMLTAFAIFVLWAGSLFLASGTPPEEALPSTTRRFSSTSLTELLEHASVPVLVTERDTIASANQVARDILGKHILGQDARVVFRQPAAIALINGNQNGSAIAHGLVQRRDIWQISRWRVDERLAVIELISKTAEADISRAHTDFVANASHELRTPLAAILGYVETLSESGDEIDRPTANRFLSTIQEEAQRLQNLISDLMSLSRVEAEKHDQPVELIRFDELAQRAARDAAGAQRIERLVLDLAPGSTVRGDVQQLEQLVRNLVDNAFKYGQRDSNVVVCLKPGRMEQLNLSVSDQGEGIAPEHIPHLTRRFYRTDPGRSRASGGTGLGLAIVKHIVERHRGRLDIESKLGEGTTVTVRLPKADPQTDPQNTQENLAQSLDAS